MKDLPPSDDKYWEHSDKHQSEAKFKKCNHEFELVTARQIQCKRCHFGLYLNNKDKFEDGHLYRKGKLII